jgi:uncharacterized protein YggE
MKYIFIIIISLFSTFITAEQFVKKGIEVIGKGSVSAEHDQFTFTVSINKRGNIASKAKAWVDQKSGLVTNLYLSMGIAKTAIESSRLELMPRYEKRAVLPEYEIHQRLPTPNENKLNKERSNTKVVISSRELADNTLHEQEKIYFEVSRTITVTFTDFSLYDQLLDNVVRIGVSRISALQTETTNNEILYQQALLKALENAQLKARAIANKIGVQLGKVSIFEESSYHTPNAYAMASRSNDGFSSQVANKHVSAQVSVTFAIK